MKVVWNTGWLHHKSRDRQWDWGIQKQWHTSRQEGLTISVLYDMPYECSDGESQKITHDCITNQFFPMLFSGSKRFDLLRHLAATRSTVSESCIGLVLHKLGYTFRFLNLHIQDKPLCHMDIGGRGWGKGGPPEDTYFDFESLFSKDPIFSVCASY